VFHAARWLERFAWALAAILGVLWWTGHFQAFDVTSHVLMIGIMIGSVVIVAIGWASFFRRQAGDEPIILEERQDG
jgi:hypothetical protein